MRRVSRVSMSSELIMCGGRVHSIVLLSLVAICQDTIDLCISYMFFNVCCSDCVWACGNVCCEAQVVEDRVLALEC